jgi:Uma2 family endonuclease
MSAQIDHPKRHLVTAQEYLRMGETGVFAPDARLELIEGEIFEMAPIGPPHAGAVITLSELLILRAHGQATVSVQLPVIAGELSVPQPDFALLKPRRDNYSIAHPVGEDILLAVEVSDTTLRADLRIKAPLYARTGIPEYWVVDVNERAVHVFREPGIDGYRNTTVAKGEDELSPVKLPDVRLRVKEIFPQ